MEAIFDCSLQVVVDRRSFVILAVSRCDLRTAFRNMLKNVGIVYYRDGTMTIYQVVLCVVHC